jgi:hypothetical protein
MAKKYCLLDEKVKAAINPHANESHFIDSVVRQMEKSIVPEGMRRQQKNLCNLPHSKQYNRNHRQMQEFPMLRL